MDDEDSSSNGEQPAARHAYNALDADNQVRAMDEEESDDPESMDEESNSDGAANADDDGAPIEPSQYDPEITTNHIYMGQMQPVSGMEYFHPGTSIRIYYCFHHTIIFPGELIPMMFSATEEDATVFGSQLVGLVFPTTVQYGLTCQVIEKSVKMGVNATYAQIKAKLRGLQRFRIRSELNTMHFNVHLLPQFSTNQSQRYIRVDILPEFYLGRPLEGERADALCRITKNKSTARKLKQIRSHARIWPSFVYEQFDIDRIMMRIKLFSTKLRNDNMPSDPVLCSFWSARNLPLQDEEHVEIFKSNLVEKRMFLIEKNLNLPYAYYCLHCDQKIANFSDVFPMTKDGVQASYCNINGFIHETITVGTIQEDSLVIEDQASTKFSWFPGYSWRICYCSHCSRHKGWKFTAVKNKLRPETFYGLSRNSVNISKMD